MRVTEVRARLVDSISNSRLKAFCTVIFDDCFAIHDVRVIDGINGLFVAMPERIIHYRCEFCRFRNPCNNYHCGGCGGKLQARNITRDERMNVAHPINSAIREEIEEKVLDTYEWELDRIEGVGTNASIKENVFSHHVRTEEVIEL